MKVELTIAHFLFMGIAVAVLLVGLVYGAYRLVGRLRGNADRPRMDDDDV